jgi:hypothetical protein
LDLSGLNWVNGSGSGIQIWNFGSGSKSRSNWSLIKKVNFIFIEELLPLLGSRLLLELVGILHRDHSRNMSVAFFSSRNLSFLDCFCKEKNVS